MATHGPAAHVFPHSPWVQRAKKNVASAAHKSVIFASPSPHAKFSSWDIIAARRNGVSAEGHYTCISSPHLPPPSYRHHASQSGVDASLRPSYSARDCCCWQRISVAAIPGVLLFLSVDSIGIFYWRYRCCVECVSSYGALAVGPPTKDLRDEQRDTACLAALSSLSLSLSLSASLMPNSIS